MKEPDFSQFVSLVRLIPEFDVDYAIEAMGGSESLYEKTLSHMVRQIPSNVEEMDSSLHTNGDLGAFAIKVHGIKSALRHVGKTELAYKAESLEKAAKEEDRTYCTGHYDSFRTELLQFHDQINEAARQSSGAETETDTESSNEADISDFIDVLKKAGEAADLCDSISAHEILLPLTKICFGEIFDNLISKAVIALDKFKPFEAFEYITEMLNEYERRGYGDEQ